MGQPFGAGVSNPVRFRPNLFKYKLSRAKAPLLRHVPTTA
jgi:hypothetical protein